MLPSLKQIRYFIAVAHCGQVSEAAINLNVSQSAVTLSIKQLEGMLNTQLFHRQSYGVHLTHEGEEFLQRALNIMNEVEEAMLITQHTDKKVEGTIRLSFTYTVSGYFIPFYLARFQRRFPNIKLILVESTRPQIEEDLLLSQIDISVMISSNLHNQEALSYHPLLNSRRRLWLSSRNPLVHQERITLSDVAREPYLMLTVDEASNTAQRYWNQSQYQPKTVFRTSSIESIRSMVGNNYGVSILSDMVYRPWSLEGNKIEVRDLIDDIPPMEIGLVWMRQQDRTEAVRAFCEFMIESVSASPIIRVKI